MTRRCTVLLMAATAAALAGCSREAPPRPAPLVATVIVGSSAAGGATLSGEVRARVDSALAFRVGGQITERPARRGQQVRRGQVLARLDAGDLSLGAAEARARAAAASRQVAAAQAAATRARTDERRLKPLVGDGGIAPQQYDAARAAADAAEADLSAARADLAAAQAAAQAAGNQQRYATLVADADGIVADLLAEPGQVVQAGQPVVRLARSGGRDAVVAVPEAMKASLPRAATASVYGAGRRYAATLREVAGAADPRTRSFEARYAIAGGDALPPGATVTLAMAAMDRDAGASSNPVAVPLGAVIDRGRGPNVWMVRPDSTVALQPVRVLGVADDMASVAGLPAGSRVVALGAHLLSPGQRVRVGGLPR